MSDLVHKKGADGGRPLLTNRHDATIHQLTDERRVGALAPAQFRVGVRANVRSLRVYAKKMLSPSSPHLTGTIIETTSAVALVARARQ